MSKKHAKIKADGQFKLKKLKIEIKGLKGNFNVDAFMQEFGNCLNHSRENRNNGNRNANRNDR